VNLCSYGFGHRVHFPFGLFFWVSTLFTPPPVWESTGWSVNFCTRNTDRRLANSAFHMPDTPSGHDVMTRGLTDRLQGLQTHVRRMRIPHTVTTLRSDVILTYVNCWGAGRDANTSNSVHSRNNPVHMSGLLKNPNVRSPWLLNSVRWGLTCVY
jgi:hypothetical protein